MGMNRWVVPADRMALLTLVVALAATSAGCRSSQKETPDERACSHGDPGACLTLAVAYGRAKDPARAASFFKKACDGGNAVACFNLGASYSNGEGVTRDQSRALSLFQKACDAGYTVACDAAALTKQREAAPAPASSQQLLGTAQYDAFIRSAAERYGLSVPLIKAVIAVGSNFNPRAVSLDGRIGLMQLMPGTARDMYVIDAYDPGQNIEGGARYLRHLHDQLDNDLVKVLAAYNAGPEAVRRPGGTVPPLRDTQDYVRKVLTLYDSYLREENATAGSSRPVATVDPNPATTGSVSQGSAGRGSATTLAGVIADGLAVGDLNRDGKADVVTGEIKANVVRVFLGDGTGKFTAGHVIEFKNRYVFPRTLTLADLDGDGILDLVVATWREEGYGGWGSRGGFVEVFRGKGDGTFGDPKVYRTEAQATALGVADFDGDGLRDVITDKEVFLGTGNGELESSGHEIKGTGEAALEMALGDLDGDGRADVLTADNEGVLRVAAGQKLKAAQPVLSVEYKKSGILKLALREVTKNHSELVVIAAEGAGRQLRGCRVVGAVGVTPKSRQSLRCGATDMANHCVQYEGKLSNFLQCRPLVLPRGDAADPEVLSVGNIGGKGLVDVAVAERGAGALILWGGGAPGKKAPPVGLRLPGVPSPSFIAVADVAGTGSADLVMASAQGKTVQVVFVSERAVATQEANIAKVERRRDRCVEEYYKTREGSGPTATTAARKRAKSAAKIIPIQCLEPGSNERRKRCDSLGQGREKLPKNDPFHTDLIRFYNEAYNQCVADMGGPTRGIVFEHCGAKGRKLLVDYCADPTGASEDQRRAREAEQRREACASALDAIARGRRSPQGGEMAWWDPVEKPWKACLAEYGFRQEANVVCANRGIADSFMQACTSAP